MRSLLLMLLITGCADQTRPIDPGPGSGADADDPPAMSEASAGWLIAGSICARSAQLGTDLAQQPNCGELAHDYLCVNPYGAAGGECAADVIVSGTLVESCLDQVAVSSAMTAALPDDCLQAIGAGRWHR